MTQVLHVGVIDVPYSGARDVGKATNGTQTTGDVAQWLEDKYNVIGTFLSEREDVVGKAIEDALEESIESAIINGMDVVNFGGACDEIAAEFRRFIDSSAIEGVAPNTPTQAALDGKTSRRKNKRGPRRPSFRDTGLYQNSFRVWTD